MYSSLKWWDGDKSNLQGEMSRRKVFTVGVVKGCNRLLREVKNPWKSSRTDWIGLGETWSSWRCPCSLQGGWIRWPFKVPPNKPLYGCVILRLHFFLSPHSTALHNCSPLLSPEHSLLSQQQSQIAHFIPKTDLGGSLSGSLPNSHPAEAGKHKES